MINLNKKQQVSLLRKWKQENNGMSDYDPHPSLNLKIKSHMANKKFI